MCISLVVVAIAIYHHSNWLFFPLRRMYGDTYLVPRPSSILRHLQFIIYFVCIWWEGGGGLGVSIDHKARKCSRP